MEQILITGKSFKGWLFNGTFESAAEIYGWLKNSGKVGNFKLSSNFEESFLEFSITEKQLGGNVLSRNLLLKTGDYLLKTGDSFDVLQKHLYLRYFSETPATTD